MIRTISRLGLALAIFTVLGFGTPEAAEAQRIVDQFAVVNAPPLGSGWTADLQIESTRPAIQEGFETTGFAQFIASPAGRVLRGVAGAAMIGGGIAIGDGGGTALAIAGALPLSAGILDLCYISALFGGPIRGEDIRAAGR